MNTYQDLSNAVYKSKYQLMDKNGNIIDFDRNATFARVAKALAACEIDSRYWEKEFYYAMSNGAIPAGRITSNAGAGEHKLNTSLINCIVSDIVHDSIEGIGQAIKDSLITLSTGAGVGYCFSTLRPRGAHVAGVGASTSGPLPFADIFDKGCFTIASAGGRRGAQMATFDIRHPDVLDFVKVKREDGRFRQFNISVLVPDSFFDNDTHEWSLRFPIRKNDPYVGDAQRVWDYWHVQDENYIQNEQGQTLFKVYNEVSKKELFGEILKSNYDYAEPGMLFIDKINRENNLWFCEYINATNPCITGDTKIAVAGQGAVAIKDLAETGINVPVFCQNLRTGAIEVSMGRSPRKTGEKQKVYKVMLDDGSSFKTTENHGLYLRDGTKVKVAELKVGDSLLPFHQRVDIVDHWDGDWSRFVCDCEDFNHKVLSVEFVGYEDVYNITVDKHHNYFIVTNEFEKNGNSHYSGILSQNCGEQPLPPNGACLLGSIDLTRFVENPFTDEAVFQWEKFICVVKIFTRLLDNVVELNNLPLEAQRNEIVLKRRHGMGFFGLGSTLIMLNHAYDSPEALDFAEMVARTMAVEGFKVGVELAKEKGPAPIFEKTFKVTQQMVKTHPAVERYVDQEISAKDLFVMGHYIQRLCHLDHTLKSDLLQYGCRFTHHTSIAPTGTISLAMGNNASGGIEPSFSHHYYRNVTKEGKKTRQQESVYSKEFLLFKSFYGTQCTDEELLKQLPPYFSTADSVHWKDHINMIAAVQPWIDSSISKCVEGSTLVPTNYGLKRMDELSKVLHTTHDSFEEPLTDLKVLCPDGKMRNVTNHYFGGEKQCKKIRFNNGYELTASLTHRVKTPFGWKTFGELLVGDSVLCSSDVTEYEGVAGHSLPEAPYEGHYSKSILIPTQVTTDFSLFVGMWLADGSLTESNGAINFTNSDDFVIDQYVELIVELFSINPRIVYDTRSSKKLRTVTFASKRCCQWLKGLCGHKAGGKKIPDQIMTGSRDELLALLKGLSLDGCNLDNATCIYEGKSYLLAKQLFEISFVLGLEPRFGKKWVNTHNYYVYGVRIYGFNGCLESRKDSGGKHDRLVPIPNEVYTLEFDSSHPQRVVLGVIQRGERHSGSIKEATLIKLGVAYDPTIYSVLITDIKDVVTKVYDITVEESHDYSLGGIWSHNTINVPTDISFEEFIDVYDYAYKKGCKAVSTYRYNPETLGAILSRSTDLDKSQYEFTLKDGTVVVCKGSDTIEYDGETTTAENLFSALKEKTYGKF